MGVIKKTGRIIKRFFQNPYTVFAGFAGHGWMKWVPDKLYLKLLYRGLMGRKLNLKKPVRYNEKLQWLKLYDRNPAYTTMVDKWAVRAYVAEKLGEEYLIPSLGVWDRFEDIDFDALPQAFVLKCTHDSGGLVICRDKATLDMAAAKRKIEKSLKTDFYRHGREWPYKNVKPRIVAEAYMTDSTSAELRDYKFFCFGGEPELTLVCSERFAEGGLHETFYDKAWNRMPVARPGVPVSEVEIPKPLNYEKMLELSRVLAKDIPFVRIDFYEIDGKIYFGEITFFPAGGLVGFEPDEWDTTLGEMIPLPSEKKE